MLVSLLSAGVGMCARLTFFTFDDVTELLSHDSEDVLGLTDLLTRCHDASLAANDHGDSRTVSKFELMFLFESQRDFWGGLGGAKGRPQCESRAER